MVDILALVLQHDEQAVLTGRGDGAGGRRSNQDPCPEPAASPGRRQILTPPTIDAPQALTLINEPKANVERYDALRQTEVRHAS
jgi:hypothetical protein